MFITSVSSITTFCLYIAFFFTHFTISTAEAWEVRIIGYKGAIFEDNGLAHYTKCIRLDETIFAEKVKFEARQKSGAALELFSDDECEHRINKQCSNPWMEDYHPRPCVVSYKVGMNNNCRPYD